MYLCSVQVVHCHDRYKATDTSIMLTCVLYCNFIYDDLFSVKMLYNFKLDADFIFKCQVCSSLTL